jgi:toxin ParE1/3/4
MAKIKWADEALDWLEDIHRYIALDNPQAAKKVIDGIMGKAELLSDFPDIGTRLRVVPEGEIRMVFYGHYRIAYLRRHESEPVEILGVFHDALDIDRYFP